MGWQFPGDIRGWLTYDEGQALADLARDRIVLEIGSYAGKSTICMAQTAAVVHSIDWHQGGEGTGPAWTLAEFGENLRTFGLLDKVVIHCGRSTKVGPFLRHGTFDLVFIDGAHDVASVLDDLRLANRVVKPDGILAFHDALDHRVKEAIRLLLTPAPETYPTKNLMWRRP